MKTAEEYGRELDNLQQNSGVQQKHELAAFIQKIQDEAWAGGMMEAYDLVMDDTVTYPGITIKKRVKERRKNA